jgi:hypothetical protein
LEEELKNVNKWISKKIIWDAKNHFHLLAYSHLTYSL